MTKENDVGYGKPPVSGQFPKGKSGNPKGRPKKNDRNKLEDTLDKILSQHTTMMKGTSKHKITLFEAMLHQLVQKALKGDPRATKQVLELMKQWDEKVTREPLPWTDDY